MNEFSNYHLSFIFIYFFHLLQIFMIHTPVR